MVLIHKALLAFTPPQLTNSTASAEELSTLAFQLSVSPEEGSFFFQQSQGNTDLNTPSRVTPEVSVHCFVKWRLFLNKNTLEVLNISYPTGFININLLSHINSLKEFLISLKQHKSGRIQVLCELLAQYSCQSHISRLHVSHKENCSSLFGQNRKKQGNKQKTRKQTRNC